MILPCVVIGGHDACGEVALFHSDDVGDVDDVDVYVGVRVDWFRWKVMVKLSQIWTSLEYPSLADQQMQCPSVQIHPRQCPHLFWMAQQCATCLQKERRKKSSMLATLYCRRLVLILIESRDSQTRTMLSEVWQR